MDPLSVTASIIAIIQLSNKIVGYLVDFKDASKERAMCTMEMANLNSLLVSLRCHLEDNANTEWNAAVRSLAIENGPLDQFKRGLEMLQDRLTDRGRLKNVQNRFVWKFKKEEVTSLLSRIERLKTLVEIALQNDHFKLSQAIKDDTQIIRSEVSSFRTQAENDKFRKILEWLSPTNYPAQQSDIIKRRQEGTGQWFLDSAELSEWLIKPHSTLFCPGIPGAGKTIVSAILIHHLSDMVQNGSVGVTYIYCNYKSKEEQSASKMLAAILKQLVQARPSLYEPVKKLHEKHAGRGTRPLLSEIFEVLKDIIASHATVYVVIDALDEFHDSNGTTREFLAKLADLQVEQDVRSMVTSRFVPELMESFKSSTKLEICATKKDIEDFIAGQMYRLPKCIQTDPDLQIAIINSTTEASSGMFLLARLFVDSLLDKRTRKKVRASLEALCVRAQTSEQIYDQAYDEAMDRIQGQLPEDTALAKRALGWITNARRPLRVTELCHALAVEPQTTALDPENIPEIEDIVSVTSGLVLVDEQSNIVRLVHYTTQEYLERTQEVWNPGSRVDIASTCLQCLTFNEFRVSRDELRLLAGNPDSFLPYAAQYWGQHAYTVQTEILGTARLFLRDEDLVYSALYVKAIWEERCSLMPRRKEPQCLHLLAWCGLETLLGDYLSTYDQDPTVIINPKICSLPSPLWLAACFGHEMVVETLIKYGANIEFEWNSYTPLEKAADHGYEQIVALLINHGANVPKGLNGALELATLNDHEEVVKVLLHHSTNSSAQLNEPVNAHDREVALRIASSYGYANIVKLLLGAGTNVNARGECGAAYVKRGDALQLACHGGHKHIVELLLHEGADVNSDGGGYGKALEAASNAGEPEIVRLLIHKGANVNAGDGICATALAIRSEIWFRQEPINIKTKDEILALILTDATYLNTQDEQSRNSLSPASHSKYLEILRISA